MTFLLASNFIAGHETTANLLIWTLYLLAKNSETLAKCQVELETLQGKTADEEDLQRLVYTRGILNESMRIRPFIGIIMRKVKQDTREIETILRHLETNNHPTLLVFLSVTSTVAIVT